jgi:hypothetical protein
MCLMANIRTRLEEVGMLGKTALGGANLGSVLCILSMEDQGDKRKIAMLELWPTDRLYCSD